MALAYTGSLGETYFAFLGRWYKDMGGLAELPADNPEFGETRGLKITPASEPGSNIHSHIQTAYFVVPLPFYLFDLCVLRPSSPKAARKSCGPTSPRKLAASLLIREHVIVPAGVAQYCFA